MSIKNYTNMLKNKWCKQPFFFLQKANKLLKQIVRKIFSYKLFQWVAFIIILLATIFFAYQNVSIEIENNLTFSLMLKKEEADNISAYYITDNYDWDENHVITTDYIISNKFEKLDFQLPLNASSIRIDVGTHIGDIEITNFKIKYLNKEYQLPVETYIENIKQNGIDSITVNENVLLIKANNSDPYFIIDNWNNIINKHLSSATKGTQLVYKAFICFIISIILTTLFYKRKSIYNEFCDIWSSKLLIWNLSKNDFKTRYAGSYLGITWAFVQPVVIVIIYWFVFQVGFRSAPIENFPYILWLVSGIVPWFFFNEAVSNAASSMLEYSYLVKKVVFKISILPIIKIISALFVHLFFVTFTIFLFALYGYYPHIYMLQVLYYTMSMAFLILALSFFTSAIMVFFRDLGQIISILLQVGMWLTPILWSYTMLPERFHFIYKLNPIYYIVDGYRDSFINKIWFWEKINSSIYFWSISLILFMFGKSIFKKLKIHFADVL